MPRKKQPAALDLESMSDEELERIANSDQPKGGDPHGKEEEAQGVLTGEVMPAQQPWDAAQAGTLDRFVTAVLDNGCDIENTLAVTHCPRDVAAELMADPRYNGRFNEIMNQRVKLTIAGKASEYADTAYGGKVLTEIFKGATADENASQQARQLKAGGRVARARALIDIIKEAARQFEVINGGHSPLPDEIAEIVRMVTQQTKASSAT